MIGQTRHTGTDHLSYEEEMKAELKKARLVFESLEALKKRGALGVFEKCKHYRLNKYIALLEVQLGLRQVSLNATSKYRN